MEPLSMSSYVEPPSVNQMTTTSEIQEVSMAESDDFHSVEDSQIKNGITFNVISDEEASAEDKTQHPSDIEDVIEVDDNSTINNTNNTDLSVVIDCSDVPSEITTETVASIVEKCDEKSFFKESLYELGRSLWKTDNEKQCYTKGCLWSPDGTCCLVPVHLDGMHVIELPSDLYHGKISRDRPITKLSTAVHVKEGGTVYDCAWYPFMNSEIPATCCWLASRQHEPIQMWDAFNGELRATYRGYNDVDEVEAAISVSFSTDGTNVLGGYKKCIRIFDTDTPGRNCTKLITKQAISCFALQQNNTDIITGGSWNGVISIFDQRIANMGCLHSLFGHSGGITFLKYSNDEQRLFSGARKDNKLCLWDMRNFSKPLEVLSRTVTSNQRIYFDLSPQNEFLISGDSEGFLRIWNLENFKETKKFRLHDDSCNGVSFHPNRPIIATSAGQYHFIDQTDENDTEGKIIDYENSLIFWWIE